MTSAPNPSVKDPNPNPSSQPGDTVAGEYDGIDLSEIFSRLCRGLIPTLGFTALGLAIAAAIYLAVNPFTTFTTSMRVTFAFSGYGRGEYPDHSKFQPDDILAPDIVSEALKRQGLETSTDLQGKVRAALTVEGIIPPNIIKERDRLRAAGQALPPFIPDEYTVSLTLPRRSPFTRRQCELLLNEIVSVYQEKFQRTYTELPTAFGSSFDSLHDADYFEYELILDGELQNIAAYLGQQLDQAKTYRSPTTNLSFRDLLTEAELFSQIRLSETLGLIRQNGLSRDRAMAMVKMNYYLRTLEDQEQKAIEEEKVIDGLLDKTQERSQNYVLGIKSQAAQQRPEAPILDQSLVDSLLANDSYNFLIRRALEAGLNVKRIQAEKAQLLERIKNMEAFTHSSSVDQSVTVTLVQKSLGDLESAYKELISNIRKTQSDFTRQEFANAIHITMQPTSASPYKQLAIAGVAGGFVGLAFGIGLSLLGIYVGRKGG